MQANGQYQQTGQLQLTHPHVNYNANGINRGYENNASYNGVGALDNHFTVRKMGMSIQQHNNYVPLHKPPQSSHQEYYPNPTQKSSSQRNAPVTLNQQMMLSQGTSVSVNPHAAVRNSNVVYYQSQGCLQKTLHQSSKPRMENVSVPQTNPTTSSTMQHVRVTQQSSVHSPMYGQMSQHATPPPSYTQSVNSTFSNVPNAQNIQLHSATPATSLSTSNVSKVAANNPTVQNPCYVSQTNDNGTVRSVNGSANVSSQMVTNNANSQANFLLAPCLIQFSPIESLQQMSVGGNINVQLVQSVVRAKNDKKLNTSSAPLPSQTCLQKQVSMESNVNNIRTASQQITTAAKDHSVNRVDNSMFYHKMNDVSNSLRLSAPLNQAPELSRREALTNIDTVSFAQAKDCSLQVSPGRATRAVAVVLPLSQDGSPSKHSSASSVQSTNPASGSCFSHFKLKKASARTPDAIGLKKLLQQSTSNGSNVSTDKANVQASSPSPNSKQSSVHGEGVKLAQLPLTFAHLVQGKVPGILSKERKSKSGKGKIATRQKPCEEELSSLPATKWTLRMLHTQIEFEDKENEKKTDNKPGQYDSATQVILHYWNGDCRALLNNVKTGTLSNEMIKIREFCSKIDMDTVILSQNQNGNLSRYHVLSDGEIYQEKGSYTSCWLNINQKLDDIDKDFGLPWFLRSSRDDGTSGDTELKSKLEDNSQTKVDLAKPEELNKDSSNPTCGSPSAANCSSSTKTEIKNELGHLDPETEEKAEEIKCVSDAQSNDSSYSFKIEVLPPEEAKVIFKQIECDSLPTVDMAVSEESPPNEDEVKEFHVSPLENYCCMEKWKEKVLGLSSEGKCKCGEQSQDEEKAVKLEIQNDWALGPVDLTEEEDDDIPLFPQESDNADEDLKPECFSLSLSSESDNESQVSDNNHATPSDHHHEHEQDLVIPTEGKEDVSTNKNASEDVNASSQPVGVSDDIKENDTRPTSDSPDPVLRPFKLNKLKSYLKSQTIFESFSKSKIGGRVETAELALFGSKHKKNTSESGQQSHVPSSHTLTHYSSEKTVEAPKRLYVKFNHPLKSNKQEAEPSGKDSVRKRIHENWRNSFPLTTIRLKRKNKKFAIVSASHGTTIRLTSNKRKEKRVGSKRKSQDCNNGQCHKKKRVRVDERAMTTSQKPVDAEARPLQENVLKFNVLPNTFNFKEGSRDSDSKPDSKTDEKIVPVSAEGSPGIVPAEGGSKGAWCDESSTKSTPRSTTSVLESTGLFQEFQKRFKMRQASTED